MYLFLIVFILTPLLELYFLIRVGSVIGALPTILVAILTAVLGTWLVRRQGLGLLMRIRATMGRGEVPALEVLDGGLILLAGLILLLPGFLSDALGFLLLAPPLRHWLIVRSVRILPAEQHSASGAAFNSAAIRPDVDATNVRRRVIEGDYRRED